MAQERRAEREPSVMKEGERRSGAWLELRRIQREAGVRVREECWLVPLQGNQRESVRWQKPTDANWRDGAHLRPEEAGRFQRGTRGRARRVQRLPKY